MIRLFDQETLSGSGTHGDCTRACIRTLMQADMPDLPHPIDDETGGWSFAFFDVLEEVHGMVYCHQPVRPGKDYSFLPRVLIAAGPTIRSGWDGLPKHAVIWDREADRMVHDPHPSRDGITCITGWNWLTPVE